MEKVNSVDLSVIILTYNSKKDLERLLPSLFASQISYSYEVIMVDNGSGDASTEWVKDLISKSSNQSISSLLNQKIKLIENQNTGFAHGNNLGIKQSSGRYVLLLNPDTKLEPNTLQTMMDFMESRNDVGIAGCKVIKADGKLDLACRRRFPNPSNSFKSLFMRDRTEYNYFGVDENKSMEVDSVMGAFLLIRKPLVEKIGLLDENFFMYGEDLDWCWRCKQEGLKVWYYPAAFITHYKGSSSRQVPFKALKWFHQAMWIFYKKHYAKQHNFLFNSIIYSGINLRLGLLIIINLFRSSPAVSS